MNKRKDPRISINKLGEYMEASPSRRRTILKDQKDPNKFKAPRYQHARRAIVQYLESSNGDLGSLIDARTKLLSKHVSGDFESQDRDCSVLAIERFIELASSIDFSNVNIHSSSIKHRPLLISGVSISVNPELEIACETRSGIIVGCLKLYFAKTHPLNDSSAAHIGAVLKQYSEDRLSKIGAADHKHCHVIDVFEQKSFKAPRATKQRLKNIEAACMEIFDRWPRI